MKHYLPLWGQSLVLVLIFFAGSLAAAPIQLSGIKCSSLLYLVSMLFPLGWAWFVSRRNRLQGLGYVPLDEPRKGSFGSMFPVFALLVVATPFIGVLVEPLSNLFPMSELMKQAFEKMFDTSRPVDLFVSTSILAPLCEELLCRGLICRGMLSKFKPWVAIVFSAAVFALLHGNLQQGLVAFVLGLFMGWVYYKTHSLWCTIAIHFTNNTLSQVMMYLYPDLPMTATWASIMSKGQYTALLIASVVIVAAAIYILYKHYKDDESLVSFALRPSADREEVGR
ncbi:MAG: CPBP family intramembrane metalloprotease [Bacteroidales bacterium]|nr:CPBP family intramembrane metalloprotease [Bacteroidales bacterium]